MQIPTVRRHPVFFGNRQSPNVDGLTLRETHVHEANLPIGSDALNDSTLANSRRTPQHERGQRDRSFGIRPQHVEMVLEDTANLGNGG